MPLYVYDCPSGHRFERYLPISDYAAPQHCDLCGGIGQKVLFAPMIFVQPDICYESPIDGRPITSMAARKDDLARSGCIPYDPEMKKDAERARQEADRKLEEAIGRTVEEELAKMPSRKLEKLQAELDSGIGLEVVRG